MSGTVSGSAPPPEDGAAALPPMDHATRRERARDRLADGGLTLLLVTGRANVRYLTGFTGSNGQLLLAADAAGDRLVTDPRYVDRAEVEVADLEVVVSRDPAGAALDAIAGFGGDRLGFEASHLTWHAGEQLRSRAADAEVDAAPTRDVVEPLRAVKDEGELARLARACRITADALAWLLADVVAVGRTERELALALEQRMLALGADGIGFPSIVASGPNAAVPHHEPGARQLGAGDLLVVDCGAEVDGYHADMTRTVAVGHLDDHLASIHEVVVAAQAAGRRAAVAGVRAGEVDAAARGVVDEAGYGPAFVHGTGHGVGLEVHEAPPVARGSRATLAAGTALTVEPGIYLPGTGGVRIEDTIVVTADGAARTLTDTPRQLAVL